MTGEMPVDAQTWLDDALEDLRWARHSLEGSFYAQACFACQQTAEKLFKAFLLAHDVVPPKIHELVRLIELCAEHEADVAALEQAARTLDQYYIATRYPDLAKGKRPHTEEEAQEAIELGELVLDTLRPTIEGRIGEA